MRNILVTGAAGFIGFHLCQRLLARGDGVVGIDNLDPYYDVELKRSRLRLLQAQPGFHYEPLDLADESSCGWLAQRRGFDAVVHLAAQAGVRLSVTQPQAYVRNNLVAFAQLIEACRQNAVPHFIFASSSSVYGASARLPWSARDAVDHPVSMYAATKKSNELIAHAYAHVHGLPCTGLRYFTVYGPWGRPDMAYFKFTRAILAGEPIALYNEGRMRRDFTYIDDVIEAMLRVLERPAQPDPNWEAARPDPSASEAPYRIYNIGNHQPVELIDFVRLLEKLLGRPAKLRLAPMQAGDVLATYADTSGLIDDFGFAPATTLESGLRRFVDWYREHYPQVATV